MIGLDLTTPATAQTDAARVDEMLRLMGAITRGAGEELAGCKLELSCREFDAQNNVRQTVFAAGKLQGNNLDMADTPRARIEVLAQIQKSHRVGASLLLSWDAAKAAEYAFALTQTPQPLPENHDKRGARLPFFAVIAFFIAFGYEYVNYGRAGPPVSFVWYWTGGGAGLALLYNYLESSRAEQRGELESGAFVALLQSRIKSGMSQLGSKWSEAKPAPLQFS